MHTVEGTARLLHGAQTDVFADAGYQGVSKRAEHKSSNVAWHVAMKPGKRRALNKKRRSHRLIGKCGQLEASVRAKVEHPLRVVKQQFGHAKVRCRGLAKNTARLTMLSALSNPWMARRTSLGAQGRVGP